MDFHPQYVLSTKIIAEISRFELINFVNSWSRRKKKIAATHDNKVALSTKQLLPSGISENEQEKQYTSCCGAPNKDFEYPVSFVQLTRDVHSEYPGYQGVGSYSKRCNGQYQLELDEFISLVVKLNVDIVFCVINILTNL